MTRSTGPARAHPLPPPLDFGWRMRTLDTAQTSLHFRRDGLMELTIDHALLKNIHPAMLRWWFEGVHLDMPYAGRVYPRYRVWHPRDHIALTKPRLVRDGRVGEGAHFRIMEVFGRDERYRVDSVEYVEKLDDTGIRLVKFLAGVPVFSLEHWFTSVPGGTRYESQMLVGTSSPMFRRVLNGLLTRRVFPEAMGRAWLRHNIEEVGNFEFFLPDLWSTRSI
ncbi:DAPG hydrolase family protein [Deinococcus yavapaiensis]|uniref:DAPG hydrolase PhiG domain-containing protein n=1 Tax=Deinococcus yavapaiensis KR-236 TaxID=694435 RepID=A0A318S1Y5_9DEIO|nr:hypothetical protein [Deinococcus yavapaiensis]PYE50494.1 hypothetical protein DES52_11712 [Deinococcus yavapaiensis KR-236]